MALRLLSLPTIPLKNPYTIVEVAGSRAQAEDPGDVLLNWKARK